MINNEPLKIKDIS